MNESKMASEIEKAAIAIRSSGNLGAFSFFIPVLLIFSIPLSFVALWRRKTILQDTDVVNVLKRFKSVKKNDLHKLKAEKSLEGSAALFLIHNNSAYNALAALGFWIIACIVGAYFL